MNVFHFYNHFFLWPDNFDEDFSFFKNGFYGNYILYSFFDTFKKGSSFCHLILSLHLTLSVYPSDTFLFTPFSPENRFVQCVNMMVNLCQYY